uniref:Uncharacterized protein n=1 Tax=Arundo donax TaxID=35708 RepID=A0A0A9HM66_ARUDO
MAKIAIQLPRAITYQEK